MTTETVPAFDIAEPEERLGTRIWENLKGGNLGSLPVAVGLTVIVVLFAFTAENFFTAVNFNNIIVQMAGTTMLAFGVVFVLLLGEIDLSIAYLSAIVAVLCAELQQPDSGHFLPGVWPIVLALGIGVLIGAFQGSFVAIIGVPSFVVTLAGLLAWQGFVQRTLGAGGPIIIENRWVNYTASYFFSRDAGWIIWGLISLAYVGSVVFSVLGKRRHGVTIRYPYLVVAKAVTIPAGAALVVAISNHDRGVPLAGLIILFFLVFWTYVAKRTTFGRHVYAVGGNAEAARRAGINVPRIRILVFMIAGAMSGLGGVVLAARLQSVDLQAGSGTLLLDVISAAVIGGTSLFGGRGEVRNALIGSALIYTIQSGMFIKGYATGIIFIVTGIILLLAVTFDTVVRRLQTRSGR
jgi:D-xylose transport system permease protein